MKKVFRYEVPIDDEWHNFDLKGKILHVDQRARKTVVEFWAMNDDSAEPIRRSLRVFGTGHVLAEEAEFYYGTAMDNSHGMVWHLFGRKLS